MRIVGIALTVLLAHGCCTTAEERCQSIKLGTQVSDLPRYDRGGGWDSPYIDGEAFKGPFESCECCHEFCGPIDQCPCGCASYSWRDDTWECYAPTFTLDCTAEEMQGLEFIYLDKPYTVDDSDCAYPHEAAFHCWVYAKDGVVVAVGGWCNS